MLNCVDFSKTLEVQTLQKRSGLKDFDLKSLLRHYSTRHNGRLPYLDELKGANSEPALIEELGLTKKYNSTTVENVLEKTGASSIEEAVIKLNNEFRDLQITAHQMGSSGRVRFTIEHRPIILNEMFNPEEIQDTEINMLGLLSSTCDRLALLYGINIINVSTGDINSDPVLSKIPDATSAKAFIYNGQIYINTDNSTADSRLHEFLHLILGSVKQLNNQLYSGLVLMALSFPSFLKYFTKYLNKRTATDIMEEFMVTKMAEYLANSESGGEADIISKLDEDIKYQIFYNFNRVLDSVFMGKSSVKAISSNRLYNYSLREVAEMVDSAILHNNFLGTMSDSKLSRLVANVKSDLLELGKLEQLCE